jgi:fused signal recognition particle receptor
MGDGLSFLVGKRRLDQALLDEIEDVLIAADLGPDAARDITARLAQQRWGEEIDGDILRSLVAQDIAAIMAPLARPLTLTHRPHVVLVVGVNGSGKTTTIGKLAHLYKGQGKTVLLAAGDTFRAAAIEQLQIWGARAGIPVVAKGSGADAAGLAFEALERAIIENVDMLLIDTAGRLHNRADLMAELGKIKRVLQKRDPEAPQDCLLVLDATVGQNAIAQVDTFRAIVPITGLVMTKLDGSAKGGILVALAKRFTVPIIAIGVGEGADDLQPFDANSYARALMGIEEGAE